MEKLEKYKRLINFYENGLFNNLISEYDSLKNEEKRDFIAYCEREKLESVLVTILEFKTYIK